MDESRWSKMTLCCKDNVTFSLFFKAFATFTLVKLIETVILVPSSNCHHLLSGNNGHVLGKNWDPLLCAMKNYTADDVKRCSIAVEEKTGQPATLNFIGDSAMLEVADTINSFLHGGFMEEEAPSLLPTNSMVLWYPYEHFHMVHQANVFMANRTLRPYFQASRKPTLVVFNGGSWHFASSNPMGSLSERKMFQEASFRHIVSLIDKELSSADVPVIWTAHHKFFNASEGRRTAPDILEFYNSEFVPSSELFAKHFFVSKKSNYLLWKTAASELISSFRNIGFEPHRDFIHFYPEVNLIRAQMVLNLMCNAALDLPSRYCCSRTLSFFRTVSWQWLSDVSRSSLFCILFMMLMYLLMMMVALRSRPIADR